MGPPAHDSQRGDQGINAPDYEHEMATTRLPLDRVPPEHAAWKPRPKSMSLGELAWHPADILFRVQATIQAESFDAHREALPSVRPRSPLVKRRSVRFDSNVPRPGMPFPARTMLR
jgi:hypothetical protein